MSAIQGDLQSDETDSLRSESVRARLYVDSLALRFLAFESDSARLYSDSPCQGIS